MYKIKLIREEYLLNNLTNFLLQKPLNFIVLEKNLVIV